MHDSPSSTEKYRNQRNAIMKPMHSNEMSTRAQFREQLTTLLVGRRRSLSIKITSIALVSTFVVMTIVIMTQLRYTPTGLNGGKSIVLYSSSYTQLENHLVSTYTGTRLYPLFVVGPLVLTFAAATSSYLNRGLFPSAALVAGPIFGLFIGKFGTPAIMASSRTGITDAPMSLPHAIVFALTGMFLYGIPIILVGFVGGILASRFRKSR